MNITIIGHWSAYPKAGEATSCYLIQEQNTKIVIDLGAGSLSLLQKFVHLSEVDAIIITHYHADHFSDVFCLQYAAMMDMKLGKRQNPLKIYAPYDDSFFKMLSFEEYTRAYIIDAYSILKMGELKITFCETKHTIYGLSIKVSMEDKSFVYTSDTEYNPQLTAFCIGVDMIIGEASFNSKRFENISGHMSDEDLGSLAENSGVKKLIAAHLPVYECLSDIKKGIESKYSGSVMLAHHGLTIEL